jgi:hypothetical protein
MESSAVWIIFFTYCVRNLLQYSYHARTVYFSGNRWWWASKVLLLIVFHAAKRSFTCNMMISHHIFDPTKPAIRIAGPFFQFMTD